MLLKGLYLIVFDHSGYELIAGAGSSEFAKPFRTHLLRSLVGSGVAVALAIAIAVGAGRIEWSSPTIWNKLFSTLGVFLSAWGTWFGVAERSESWKKSRLDERLRDAVFISLFATGVVLGAVGALW